MCVYTCVYIYMCVCVYMCMYIYIYICIILILNDGIVIVVGYGLYKFKVLPLA